MTSSPQKLIDGFVRFRERHFARDDGLFRQLVAQGQTPKTLVVACCDSRVDPALVLDCAPGDLFVIRNVANLVPPSEGRVGHHGTSAALEFGVRNLGVEHIIVLGHAHCGGIQALVETGGINNPDSFIEDWMHLVESARASVAQDMPHASLEDQVYACEQRAISNLEWLPSAWPWPPVPPGTYRSSADPGDPTSKTTPCFVHDTPSKLVAACIL